MKVQPRRLTAKAGASGFSLIEVLVSLVVLAIGLLGLAMLQTTNLRLAQSSNQRTLATNLASELMDDIRSNRLQAAEYGGSYLATDGAAGACVTGVSAAPSKQKDEFKCKLRQALGDDATANVDVTNGKVVIKIDWPDAKRWGLSDGTSFTVETLL